MSKTRINAVLYFLGSVMCMHGSDVLVKLRGSGGHFSQSVFFRFFSAAAMLLPFMYYFRSSQPFKVRQKRNLTFRSGFLFLATCFWFRGLENTSIALATVIAFFIPILTLIFSTLLLKERLTLRKSLANFLGFAGIMLAIGWNFQGGSLSGPAFLFAGSVCFALFAVCSKKSAVEESPLTTLFWTAAIAAVLSFPVALSFGTELLVQDLPLYFMLGVLANLNSGLLLRSYQLEEASFLAPLLYCEMILSLLSSVLIFDETVCIATVLGSVMIFMSNLMICYSGEAQAAATVTQTE